MRAYSLLPLALGLLSEAAYVRTPYSVKPIQIDLSSRVPHMLDLIKRTNFPPNEAPAEKDSHNTTISTGISLSTLKTLAHEWVTTFSWEKEQKSINQYHHFTTNIEGQDVHFIHEKSKDPNAIPIILLHGWPGSVLEMIHLIDPLTSRNGTGGTTFNVVIPSLPGFGLSSAAPDKWTNSDTARIFNTLMTKVLGYDTYAVHGTDWGCAVGYYLYEGYNTTARAAHFNFLPFFPLNPEQLAAENITLSGHEIDQAQRDTDFLYAGFSYFQEQVFKPNTIGLAIYDSPIGQLTWIGEKIILWSDPRQGTGPSLITHNEILRHVSFYYLTQTIISSVYIYNQNPLDFRTKYTKAPTDAPMLYSSFNYNNGFWPKGFVEKVGNLVSYKFQEFGGHFPALDNPQALAEDIGEIGKYWKH